MLRPHFAFYRVPNPYSARYWRTEVRVGFIAKKSIFQDEPVPRPLITPNHKGSSLFLCNVVAGYLVTKKAETNLVFKRVFPTGCLYEGDLAIDLHTFSDMHESMVRKELYDTLFDFKLPIYDQERGMAIFVLPTWQSIMKEQIR